MENPGLSFLESDLNFMITVSPAKDWMDRSHTISLLVPSDNRIGIHRWPPHRMSGRSIPERTPPGVPETPCKCSEGERHSCLDDCRCGLGMWMLRSVGHKAWREVRVA
ncbi:unnamed protein product, partial [Larinioides sclopetarius]